MVLGRYLLVEYLDPEGIVFGHESQKVMYLFMCICTYAAYIENIYIHTHKRVYVSK